MPVKPFRLQLQCGQHCWNYCTATKWDFVASLRSVRIVSAKFAKCGLNQLISGVEPTRNGDFSNLNDMVHHLESISIYIYTHGNYQQQGVFYSLEHHRLRLVPMCIQVKKEVLHNFMVAHVEQRQDRVSWLQLSVFVKRVQGKINVGANQKHGTTWC